MLVRLGPQLLGALTFSYNWISLTGGGGYFAADTPELFRNLWSLAVEEQFYVLWPLLLPLLLLIPSRRVRVAIAAALALASATGMAAVVLTTGDLTRAYFGTDTHAFGILIGVALAAARHTRSGGPSEWAMRRHVRAGVATAGTVALAALVAVACLPETATIATFPGVLLAASLLSAVVIVAAIWPGALLGRALDLAPLRWIGERSYGIYLWHWPLLVLVLAGIDASSSDVPVGVGVLTLAMTLAIAALSARFVEMPVRRHGFGGALQRLWGALTGTPRTRVAAIGTLAVAALLLGGTSAALAAAPAVTSAQSAVRAGAAALAQASAEPDDTPAPHEAGPSPQPVTGDEITAVGDSVMLASAPALLARFPGIDIDAEVSRPMRAAPRILRGLADRGALRPFVVVGLGTNGPIDAGELDAIRDTIGPDRWLVLVDASAPRDWIPGVNRVLDDYANSHDRVEIADWAGAIAPHEDLLAEDRIHPGDAGGRIFADAVAAALDAAERARALKAYQDETRARQYNEGIVPIVPR